MKRSQPKLLVCCFTPPRSLCTKSISDPRIHRLDGSHAAMFWSYGRGPAWMLIVWGSWPVAKPSAGKP